MSSWNERRTAATWVALALWPAACARVAADSGETVSFTDVEVRRILQHSPVPAPPEDETNRVAAEPAAARLGQRLFFETRLSADGRVSCSTCHDPTRGFTDGQRLSIGQRKVQRHTPSLWNAAYGRWFFWDGRADSLWSQALKPIESPDEMGGSRLQSVHLLAKDPSLRSAYEEAFGPMPALSDPRRFPRAAGPAPRDPSHPLRRAWDAMTPADRVEVSRIFANLGKAIAAFERRLVSRPSPFDVFAEGLRTGDPKKTSAIGEPAKRGLRLFVGRANCRRCHGGPLFTDGEFHDIGVPVPADAPLDVGRYGGIEALAEDEFRADGAYSDDREGPRARQVRFLSRTGHTEGLFKTPSLRNVAATAPYMHQGQLATLRDVLEYYSTLRGRRAPLVEAVHLEVALLPLRFSESEIDELMAFLESLTDTQSVNTFGEQMPLSDSKRS